MACRERVDAECCVYENPDTKVKYYCTTQFSMIVTLFVYLNQDAVVYETPREELFDTAGLYVPTAVSQCIQYSITL